MANEQNLKPYGSLTESEQRALTSAGGIASGKKRREKKLMREVIGDLMKLEVTDENIRQTLEDMGIPNKDNQTALIVGIYLKALRGDVRAGEFIRDTMGERPVEVTQQLEPPVFIDDIK